MKKLVAGVLGACALALPMAAYAYPFGGKIGQIIFCYNNAIYAAVGPPRGGPFIWTPSTRTYQFGPPSHTGQWLLGLAAPPYYCLVSIQPIIVWSGILMTMEGSSGAAAPGGAGGGLGNFPGGNAGGGGSGGGGTGGSGGSGTAGINHMVVSEVYYQADSSHGGQTEDQWIELYNPTSASISLSGWTIRTNASSQTLPNNTTLAAGSYMVLAGTASVRTIWTIPANSQVIPFQSSFAGFAIAGDHVYLQDPTGVRVDAVSYGTDTTAFSPAVTAVQLGHAITRKNLVTDTNSNSDWNDAAAPTPGR